MSVRVLAGLLVSCVVLLGVELGKGALSENPPKIADPCRARDGRSGGFDATVQRIVLDGVDGAACRLHTTREELVLSLDGGTGVSGRRWDEHTIEVAVRAGLLRSLDEARRRGDVPGFLEPALRAVIERAPLGAIIRGGISLSDLLG